MTASTNATLKEDIHEQNENFLNSNEGYIMNESTSNITCLHTALSEVARLRKLLDNIDTAGDMFKPKRNPYFEFVTSQLKEAEMDIDMTGIICSCNTVNKASWFFPESNPAPEHHATSAELVSLDSAMERIAKAVLNTKLQREFGVESDKSDYDDADVTDSMFENAIKRCIEGIKFK